MKYFICLAALAFLENTAWAGDVSQEKYNVGKVSCVFCKMVLNTIDEIRGEKPTKKENEYAVKNVCNTLPTLFKTDCHMLIDPSGDEIIKLLNNNVPIDNVCSQLELCPKKTVQEEQTEGLERHNSTTDVNSLNPVCIACRLAIKEIYKLIETDKSLESIRNVVDHVCLIIPKKFRDHCKDSIDKHNDEVVKLILKLANPKLICLAIRACIL